AICKEEFAAGRHTAPDFNAKLQWTKDIADNFNKEITKIDRDRMDLTHVPRSTAASLWMRFTRNVEWMSISDMIAMFRDMKEDIQRMWNRRSQAARSRMGERITGLIPEVIPYFGWLKHDFRGREKASEQEEVGIWEKRYEKIDEEQLLKMVGETTNRDQVKAIVNLLTKRGRMDFDCEAFWTTLERLSRYSMPHGPCRRDNLLRNTYLQKLITDIWGEKSLFEHWKTTNDGGIKTGKDSFQATCDDLSSVSGGLAGQLQRLLENHIKKNKKGISLSKEEEVNPHLYEKVLNYAMKNGKMNMQDKFFFLIQGIAHGIMNVDRLRGFTGEQGEILNSFPFIDYFTNKNNTLPEIEKIASRIGTPGQVEPDYRTTYFLYQEVMPNDSARKRMLKALKNVQNIDHEDFPMLMSTLDYNNVTNVISFFSGNQPKVSSPAMQNGYVGYNTLFQYYAARARMYLEGVPGAKPLTKDELRRLATSIAAFVHYDNLVTNTAIEPQNPNRPRLSWNEIHNVTPVSGYVPTSQYRDKASSFAFDFASELDIGKVNGLSLDEVIGKDRQSINDINGLDKEKRKTLGEVKTPENLETQLAEHLIANPDRAMEILRKFSEGRFLQEGGKQPETGEGFLYNNIKQIAKDWA
ncbi:MAG: hypothetical protein WC654_07525, partial [Patescibacteria group bacterium]